MTEEQARKTTVSCEHCRHEYFAEDNIQSNLLAGDVTKYSVVCPNCNESTHAFFHTPDTLASKGRMQAALARFNNAKPAMREIRWNQFQFQREVYKALFEREQKRLKKKYKIPERVNDNAKNLD